MAIYLYKKTHLKTGLKYLGKTEQDPFKYPGSGIDWKKHLKEHGNDVVTEIIKECNSKEEFTKWGRFYSELWNVAKSDEWANRIAETGGSDRGENHPGFGIPRPDTIQRNKARIGSNHPLFGTKNPELSKRNASNTGEKNPMFGKPSAMRGKKNPAISALNAQKTGKNNPMCKPEYQLRCEHCDRVMSKGNYLRWHGAKCKNRQAGDL